VVPIGEKSGLGSWSELLANPTAAAYVSCSAVNTASAIQAARKRPKRQQFAKLTQGSLSLPPPTKFGRYCDTLRLLSV